MAGAAASGCADASTLHSYLRLPVSQRRGIGSQASRLFRRARRPLRRLTARMGGGGCGGMARYTGSAPPVWRHGSAVAADGGATPAERRKWALGCGRIGAPAAAPHRKSAAGRTAWTGTGVAARGRQFDGASPRQQRSYSRRNAPRSGQVVLHGDYSETLVRGPASRLGPEGEWLNRKASVWSGFPATCASSAVTSVAEATAEVEKSSDAAAATPARWRSAVQRRQR